MTNPPPNTMVSVAEHPYYIRVSDWTNNEGDGYRSITIYERGRDGELATHWEPIAHSAA